MAARSSASLTVSFGLVAIPVRLYSATVSAGQLRFRLLHGTAAAARSRRSSAG